MNQGLLRFDSPKLDWVLAGFVFAAALAIRLPNFMQVPRFADEGFEVLWGLDIALGKHLPLTGFTQHYGPFFSYLMALLFRVFGIHIELPRLATTTFGALTVAMTFGLGRVVLHRAAGIVGAALAMTSPVLIVYNSHYGWSASLAPFFAAATVMAFYSGILKERKKLLVGSGLLAALTLQAHPTTIVILLGCVMWFFHLPDWRARIRQPSVLLAMLFFLIGYAPMLVAWAIILNPLSPTTEAVIGSFALPASLNEYLSRLTEFLRFAGYFLGGGFGPATLFLRAQAIVVESIFLLSLIWLWRKGLDFIPIVLAVSILVLPTLFLQLSERYYLSLYPLAYVAMGILVSDLARSVRQARLEAKTPSFALDAIRLGLPVLVMALVLVPLWTLWGYYQIVYAEGSTNQEYFRLLETVRQEDACRESLLIEDAPMDFSTLVSVQSWYSLHAIDYILALSQCTHTMVPLEEMPTQVVQGTHLVLSEPSFEQRSDRTRFDMIAKINPPFVVLRSLPILFLKVHQ